MKKPVYKLLDEKGRVLIPLEMRQKAEIEKGDILKVSINTGKIVISKVDILEVLANADVNVAGIMTIRNVKIKQDDYGLTVTMPRTKMPHTEQYKDSVYFADKSMKQQFDMAVETAYQESVQTQTMEQDELEEGMEQEEDTGMSMGMQ